MPRPSPRWGLSIPAAILAFPLGLLAVFFSSQTTSKWNRGDVAGAQKSSQYALISGIILLSIGVMIWLAFSGG
jgi:hypothetical protein